jgi:hypothetical protein
VSENLIRSLPAARHRPCGEPLRESFCRGRGGHADLIESHTHTVVNFKGTSMDFWNKRFMRVPMGFYTNCVFVLWNPHESLGALE